MCSTNILLGFHLRRLVSRIADPPNFSRHFNLGKISRPPFRNRLIKCFSVNNFSHYFILSLQNWWFSGFLTLEVSLGYNDFFLFCWSVYKELLSLFRRAAPKWNNYYFTIVIDLFIRVYLKYNFPMTSSVRSSSVRLS